MSILPKIFPRSEEERIAAVDKQLIHFESQFGRQLFGAIPKGHSRDFFCLDERTWVWHEDWVDEKGKHRMASTRYIIRPDGAIKSLNGQSYQRVEEEESKHLYHAIKKYVDIVVNQYDLLLGS